MNEKNEISIDLNVIQGKIYYMIASWYNLDVDVEKKQELLSELSYKIAEVTLEEATKEIAISKTIFKESTKNNTIKQENKQNIWRGLKSWTIFYQSTKSIY